MENLGPDHLQVPHSQDKYTLQRDKKQTNNC